MIATALGRLGRPGFDPRDQGSDDRMEPTPVTVLVGYGRGTPTLAAGLELAGLMVRTYDRFPDALADIARIGPDLILVGDADEDDSALQFVHELNERRVEGLVFFLSPSADPHHVSRVLDAGAHDVVAPPHSVRAILLRRHVQARRRQMPLLHERRHVTRAITLGELTVDPGTREVADGSRTFTLSGREMDLLVCLMEARGAVVTREQLMAEIWGNGQESEAVLDATVHRLRRRLEEEVSRPNMVATVRGIGYRLRTG